MKTTLHTLSRVATESAVSVDVLSDSGSLRAVMFDSEEIAGTRSRVFAYVASPNQSTSTPLPAVVLVHGGGGRAFSEWATMWAQRGYLAVAVDLGGTNQDGRRHERSGPPQDPISKFTAITDGVEQTWMFHAVAAVMRAISIAVATPGVDPSRVFLTGISWGSHVAQLVTALDPRVRGAAFVYGAGFIDENVEIGSPLSLLAPQEALLWLHEFDQKNYLSQISVPTLWITGTRDPHYDLDLFGRSIELMKAPTAVRIIADFDHSHEAGWSPPEISAFFQEQAGEAAALPRVREVERRGERLHATLDGAPAVNVQVHSTTDSGPWAQRRWNAHSGALHEESVVVDAPVDQPFATVISVTDSRGLTASALFISS